MTLPTWQSQSRKGMFNDNGNQDAVVHLGVEIWRLVVIPRFFFFFFLFSYLFPSLSSLSLFLSFSDFHLLSFWFSVSALLTLCLYSLYFRRSIYWKDDPRWHGNGYLVHALLSSSIITFERVIVDMGNDRLLQIISSIIYHLRIVGFALPSRTPSVPHFPGPSLEPHPPTPWPFPCSWICRQTGPDCGRGHSHDL